MYHLPKINDKKKSVCINYKCYIIIEFTFLKELVLIKQVNKKSVVFVTFDTEGVSLNRMSVIVVIMY